MTVFFNALIWSALTIALAYNRVWRVQVWQHSWEWMLYVVFGAGDAAFCVKWAIEALINDHSRPAAILYAITSGVGAWSAWVCYRDRPRKKGDKAKSPHMVKWLRGRLRLVPVPATVSA